ncbi:MAG: ABC transporter permease [Firmicutes bacterium]|nr:ABC transporter permease [Bacillota bacterium]
MSRIADTLHEKKGYLISLFVSILAALIIGGMLMAVTGCNPLRGYEAMLKGAFGSPRVFGNTLAKMMTLCLTGLAMAVGSKAGMFNVGGEGQLFLGGLAATMTAVYLKGMPAIVVVPLAFLAAAAAGGFFAWIPAMLKVKLNVSEVITTIMLNSAAIFLCAYLTNSSGPLKTHDRGVMAGTDAVADSYMFEQVIARSNLSTAIIYSAVIAFLCWYIMKRTSVGLEMKITGENERFAFFSGLNKDKIMIGAMVASGVICGLVGMFEVFGYQQRFLSSISNEFYFDGMLVAMIMNYSPLGIIIMSFFFAVIDIGASAMELSVGISGEISEIIFSIIIFLMAAEGGISQAYRRRKTRNDARRKLRGEAQQ